MRGRREEGGGRGEEGGGRGQEREAGGVKRVRERVSERKNDVYKQLISAAVAMDVKTVVANTEKKNGRL